MAKRARPSRWMQQAALQALVRFGPEQSGLRAAAREARQTFRTTVRQADATSQGIQSAISQVRPDVRANYDEAGLTAARAAHVADASLGPSVPDSIKAAILGERAGFTTRLGESRAADLTSLDQRKVQAVEGAGFAKGNAQRTLASDLAKLFARGQDLRGEQGAFTVATAQQLKTAADRAAAVAANQEAGRNQSERNSLRSAGINPDTGKPIPNGRLDPKAKKPKVGQTRGGATTVALSAASDEIARLIHEANGFKSDGAHRHEAALALLKGAKERRIPLHDKLGKPVYNPDGTPKEKVVSGLDKAKSALLLSVALDVAYDGYVSRENHRRLLAQKKLALRDLGLPSYGQVVGARKRRAAARNRAAGGTLLGPAF